METELQRKLVHQYLQSFPEDAMVQIDNLKEEDISTLLESVTPKTAGLILARLDRERAGRVFYSLNPETLAKIFRSLDPVMAAGIVSQGDLKSEKLKKLTALELKDVEQLTGYPEDSVGAMIDTSVQSCLQGQTVRSVIDQLKRKGRPVREVFVTNVSGVLVGSIDVHELLFSDSEKVIEKVMRRSPPAILAYAPRQEAIEIFESKKPMLLPVLHSDGTILGGVRYAGLVDAAQKSAAETMATSHGASPDERATSKPLFSMKKRLPWLMINLLTAFLASAVVGMFEGTIAKVTALAVLLPVVAGQSGNTGAQAMAVTMRGLSLREVRVRNWLSLVFKELQVGFFNGIVLAFVTGVAVGIWGSNVYLGIVIGFAMILSMISASVFGACVPLVLTALGRDPAQSSSVILTTLTDIVGFFTFLGLATVATGYLV